MHWLYQRPSLRLSFVWFLVVLCVGAAALLEWFEPSTSANSAMAHGSVRAEASPSTVVATSRFPPTDVGRSVRATMPSTHTVFLPLAFRDYWEAPESLLGVQMFANHREQEAVTRADQAGVRWARMGLNWSHVEPENTTPENFQWSASFDDWLARLAAENLRVILTLGGNPSWAATYAGGPIDKVEMGELVEFMEAAVAHYGTAPYHVKYWEFYNEPDNGSEYAASLGCSYFGHTPQAYVDVLAAVYQPMKEVDPEAQIVLGGLAYDWWEDASPPGPFVREFLDEVLLKGGGDYFDVMNFHYYPNHRSDWEPYGTDIIGKVNYLRDKLARDYGVSKPFICTETGMWSDEFHQGSDELQSRYVPQVFARSSAAELGIVIWFTLIDDDDPFARKWGLLNPDLSSKPAYDAYRTLSRQLSPFEYAHTLTATETGTEQIEAYEFAAAGGSTRIVVAWTEDELDHEMVLVSDQVVLVDKFGAESVILDGDDGIVDGQVWVTIGPSPVYLRTSQ